VGIAGQVVQDLLRVFERIAHTDPPQFLANRPLSMSFL
jgi:hypothetical protein